MLGISKTFREATAVRAGEHIVVTIERDSNVRVVHVPDDFADGLVNAGLRVRSMQ